jgi:hypothetical protein
MGWLSRRIIKERTIFNESDITRYTSMMRRGVITTITLMLRTIPQKNTLN